MAYEGLQCINVDLSFFLCLLMSFIQINHKIIFSFNICIAPKHTLLIIVQKQGQTMCRALACWSLLSNIVKVYEVAQLTI